MKHGTKNPIYVFPERKLRGFILNSYNHVSVINLYIPRVGLSIWLQQNRQTDLGNIEISDRYMNVELGDRTLQFCFGNNEATQFNFWEYINRNQTFMVHWILTGPSFAVRDIYASSPSFKQFS